MADLTSTCEHVRDLVPELVTDRLDPIESAAVRAHVQHCVDCRAQLEIAELVTHVRVPLPSGLEARVLRAARGRRKSSWSASRYAVAASVAVAVIGGSVVIAPLLTSPGETTPPTAVAPAPESVGPGWIGVQEAFVSGASSLRDLSVEELEKLLVEIDS